MGSTQASSADVIDSTAVVRKLTLELRADSSTVATPTPRITWTVGSDEPGWIQESVELRCDDEHVTLRTDRSVLVAWPFRPLDAAETRQLQVRVRSASGHGTAWSEPVAVTAGFLAGDEWVALPVGLAAPQSEAQPFITRTEFLIDHPVERATLLWTALGVAEPEINGCRVDDSVLAPGWTTYPKRLVHETVDVTDLLHEGPNVLGASVAGCWYSEKFGFFGHAQRVWGEQPSFLAQIRIQYVDGATETLAATGEGWVATGDGPILTSGLYAGEHQDLRKTIPGWSRPDHDLTGSSASWHPARVGAAAVPGSQGVPVPEARIAPPTREVAHIEAVEVLTTPSGATVVDFGQNLGGRVRLKVTGHGDERVTVRHAEVLEDGELALRPLRLADQLAVFDLDEGPAVLEARFSSYGFRFVQVDGWPGELRPEDVEAVALSVDLPRRGWFESSDPVLDRLHENMVWTWRASSLSVPTDSPARDERLGYTGDLQLVTPAVSTLFDVDALVSSWLRDLRIAQDALGGIGPMAAPDPFGALFTSPDAMYGDAICSIPMVLHERFGNLEVVAECFDGMKHWVDTVLRATGDTGLWQGFRQNGDWLDPTSPPEIPGKSLVDADIVASAYLARDLQLVADAAALLDDTGAAEHYGALAARSRNEFVQTYVTPRGRIASDAPTAYVLAIVWDLVSDPAVRQQMGDRLAELVRRNRYRATTGFAGTPGITDALERTGHHAVAERVLLETECPSWLYALTTGATTIWERWDAVRPDGSLNPGEMVAFGMCAFGVVIDWMHRTVAGLAPAEPGYVTVRVAPRPLDGLDHAKSLIDTAYGPTSVQWRRLASDPDRVSVHVAIPPNASAVLDLPGAPQEVVGSGEHVREFDAPRQRHPLSYEMSATVGEVLDDPAAYRTLLRVLRERAPSEVDAVLNHQGLLDMPLAAALWTLADDVQEAVGEALTTPRSNTR